MIDSKQASEALADIGDIARRVRQPSDIDAAVRRVRQSMLCGKTWRIS